MKKLTLYTTLIATVFSLPNPIFSQNPSSFTVYVWEFATREGEENDYTLSFTEEFEEALIQSECCTILQRRYYSRLLEQKQNEERINNAKEIPGEVKNQLKLLDGNTVVFGEVYDDNNSGQVKITVNFESFTGEILKKASTYLPKFALPDPLKREEAVKKLIAEIGFDSKAMVTRNNGEGFLNSPIDEFENDQFKVVLESCKRSGTDVSMYLKITRKSNDGDIKIYGNRSPYTTATRAFDNFGGEFKTSRIKAGNTIDAYGGGTSHYFVQGLPTQVIITFGGIPENADTIKLFELYIVYMKSIKFRNIKID
jgi:hypothetical protein